jgi:hypothetical protein
LLALVMLMRCFLDPVNNGYYHVPFLLALIAADALAGYITPTIVAVIALEVTSRLAKHGDLALLCGVYLAWVLPFAVYLAGRTYGLDWRALIRPNSRAWADLDTSATRG